MTEEERQRLKDEPWMHTTAGVDALLSLGPTPLQKGLADGSIIMTEYPVVNNYGETVMVHTFRPAKTTPGIAAWESHG